MKLSILLVTYNQEKYIRECVDSILIQNLPFDHEIIVADDHSTDKTLLIIKEKLKTFVSNVHFLENEHKVGYNNNYQRGFEACQGEFIAVIEGDDYWTDPDRLQKHVSFLEEHRECAMSFNRIIEYFEEYTRFEVMEWNSPSGFEYITTSKLARGNCIGNFSACVFRNSAIKKLSPDIFDIPFSDWILGMVMGQIGLIAYLKDAMSIYRIHCKGQWSKMSLHDKNISTLKQIEEYNKYLNFHYNDEFTGLKKWIVSAKKKSNISKSDLLGYIPPIIIFIIKWILPTKLLSFIKNNLYNSIF